MQKFLPATTTAWGSLTLASTMDILVTIYLPESTLHQEWNGPGDSSQTVRVYALHCATAEGCYCSYGPAYITCAWRGPYGQVAHYGSLL